MTWAVLLVSAVLAAVAAAGVLRPFARPVPLEADPARDPMDVERRSLDRAGEVLSRQTAGREGQRGLLLALLVSAAIVAGTVPLLANAVAERAPGQSITGGTPAASEGGPLSFFERRVRDHPEDLAARLDLAQRYLQAGELRSSTEEYMVALEIDPRNPEARAGLGFVLYLSGQPEEGLRSVEDALAAAPSYPEGLYFKGVILLRGLDRSDEAATALRAYLDAAPFGSHRSEVEQLLREAAAR